VLCCIQSCLEDTSEPADVRDMTKKQWLVSLSVESITVTSDTVAMITVALIHLQRHQH
jgi:hypothetical protein